MPSLSSALHKLSLGKHKRNGSTSSNGSAPSSPRQSLNAQRADGRQDESVETGGVARKEHFIPNRPAPPPPTDVEPAPNPLAGTSKSLPPVPVRHAQSGDEDRPELPTTSSNVDNPPIPDKAPQLPPLPHVTSLEQPFKDESKSSRKSVREPPSVVPPRISSVRQPTSGGTPTVPPPGQASSSTPATKPVATEPYDPALINDHWYSSRALTVPTKEETARASAEHIAHHLKHLKLPRPSATPNVILPKIPLGQGGPSLEEQRQAMLLKIADESQSRPRKVLTEEGKRVFDKAGLSHTLGIKDTVDVRTRWLEPVIQERVIRREHHEYTYEIYHEIHKYHIYPKVQPIFDPNPIVLPTRHRFRDHEGNLREVIGDEAARAILGNDMDEGVTTYVRTRVPEFDMAWDDGCDFSTFVAVASGDQIPNETTAVGVAI